MLSEWCINDQPPLGYTYGSLSAGVSLKELLDHVGISNADLDTECSDEDLTSLAFKISSWKFVARFLDLEETDIVDITDKHVSEKERAHLMLKRWKERLGFKATFRVLVEVFLEKLKNAQMAEEVCHQLKSKF